MPKNHYDYIIVGNGLAGLQLALALNQDSFFKEKSIALIDPSPKNVNDKTWSFWEEKSGKWEKIVNKKWTKANIYTSKKQIRLNLNPYTYKSIRGIDFYNLAKAEIQQNKNFTFLIETVTDVSETKTPIVTTETNSYTANHVFDSRLTKDYDLNDKSYTNIIQHFKGWVINTENNVFDDTTLTMMDYRLKDDNQTTFMYVLPTAKNKALIEFTYFTENLVEEKTYDKYIKQYISQYLKIKNYNIIETEAGQIPMTTFPFDSYNTRSVTKIGTAGGWVKPSTGYSFKNTEHKVSLIISNLKNNKIPSSGLHKSKYKFYDKIFLKVLKDENYKGEWIFQQYYSKNNPTTMFKFLDETSTFKEDLKIMWSLFSFSFIKAFFKTL
ncbi:lycopene cyclase [Olleya aquimaris]|uniref:Lycopene cyclase n=1 Tax=Olleya sediminilitoris TaxID=2795739 RepID=A0ABS1WKX9_9FLAO|nr:lycopene cyclase family protein [Olleya sediminilitoris]AXO81673.1 lycopene cyclase [Olleya aquimaris]MBL7559775.1 lycopene cyclase [Olleya sediminilitoris]